MALAPGANHTIIDGWVSDSSNSRGTFSVISSCILTLSLCVYTAIHLNVESRSQRRSTYRTWLHTTQWVVLGILAPELLCFIAWRQWISARSVSQTVEQLKVRESHPNDASIRSSDLVSDFRTSSQHMAYIECADIDRKCLLLSYSGRLHTVTMLAWVDLSSILMMNIVAAIQCSRQRLID